MKTRSMEPVEATIIRIIADPKLPGALLVSFDALAAYYQASGAIVELLAKLKSSDRVRFTHDLQCRLLSIEAM